MRFLCVCVMAVLAGGCVGNPPPFDCSRAGATCGATPGAVCVEDRCAVPSGTCPSGLVYADNAGDLAGMCVAAGAPDGGTDAPEADASSDAGPGCGNGAIDPEEDCDGQNLDGQMCTDLGYMSGTLACDSGCHFDTANCVAAPGCGDGLIGPLEQCDGANLGFANCVGLGYFTGTLACTDACVFDESGCSNCGNGVANAGEACDMTDFGGKGCSDLGFDDGVLSCTAACTVVTDACIDCGDGVAEGMEECDAADLNGNDCTTIGAGWIGGTLGCNAASCTFDESLCNPPPNCPNGVINAGEQCDGAMLGGGTCSSATGGVRPTGTLSCGAGCQYETSACYKCGDGLVEAVEMCDGTNFAGQTCVGRSHDGGNLTCVSACLSISETACTDCGDATLESPEVCDGSLLGGATCLTVGAFAGGSLGCNASCNGFDTTLCAAPPTSPPNRLPMNGAYTGSYFATGSKKPKFQWDASVYTGPEQVSYELQYSQSSSFPAGASTTTVTTTSTSFTPASDLAVSDVVPYGRRYFWHVRACVGAICSGYSPTWMVNVARLRKDFNGDGREDFAAGAPGFDGVPGQDSGRVQVFFGNSSGVDTTADATLTGTFFLGGLGEGLAVGDVNADGYADLAVGEYLGGAGNFGRTFVYLGGPGSTFTTTATATLDAPTGDGGAFGTDLAMLDSNGDGFADVVVTAPEFAYLYLGGPGGGFDTTSDGKLMSVQASQATSGGDLNGDGFDDLVIGNGTNDTKIFFGGPGALSTSADGAFASRVIAVGDVNGDGFADVAGASVFFGSAASSFDTTPDISLSMPATGGGGDVNHDGKADIVAGSMVYLGGSGPTLISTTLSTPAGATGFGAAGMLVDCSGDGFADAVIAAPDGGPGEVYVFFATSGGLEPTADVTINGSGADRFGGELSQ